MPSPPLSAVDRRALRSVAVQFFLNGAITGSTVSRFPELRDQIGVSLATFGVIWTLAGAAGLIGSAITSSFINRYSTRQVLIGGAIGQISLLAMLGFVTSPFVLVLVLAVMSISDVLVDVSMNLQGSWLSGRRSTPVINRLHGLWSLGGLVGGVVASQAARAAIELRWHLLGAAAALTVTLVYVGTGLLSRDEDSVATTDTKSTPQSDQPKPGQPKLAGAGRHSQLLLFGAVGAAAILIETTPSEWAAFRLSDDLQVSAGLAAWAFVAVACGMTLGRFVGDWMTAKFGRTVIFRSSTGLIAIGALAVSLANGAGPAIAAFALTGVGISTIMPTLYDDAARAPGARGAALGALTAGLRSGAVVGPVLVGGLASTSLSVGQAILVVVLPAVVTLSVVRQLLAQRLFR